MANSTVLSVGGVTVSTAGGLTGALLQKVIDAFGVNNANVQMTTLTGNVNDPVLPAAPTSGLPAVLVIPASDTGTISIPSGYAYVIYEGSGTLSGGDSNTALLGSDITYSGPAGTVLGTGGAESVTDSTPGATFAFFSGTYALNASGSNDTVAIDSGASGNQTISGSDNFILLGTPTTSPTPTTAALVAAASSVSGVNTVIITGTGETTSISSGTQLIDLTGTGTVPATDNATASGGTTTFIIGAEGILTLNATGGSQIVYSNALGADVINGGPSTEFVGFPGAPGSTFTASTGGADTIFAGTSINYDGTAATSSFFLGGSGVATVLAGASSTIFGGSGGGSYTAGSGGMFFWNFGGGTTDSIFGGSASGTDTIFGSSSENLVVSQLGAASGGVYVAYGASDTINAMDARGGNTFYIIDQTITVGGAATDFSGNTTLVGSSAGHDLFAMFDFGSTSGHTITIENWQASDTLFMDGYSQADSATATAALSAAAGTDATFSLTDGTTVKFVGTSPTSHV